MLIQDMKFILLHEAKNDDGIKSFFNEVWELYVKVSGALTGFHSMNEYSRWRELNHRRC